MSKDIGGRLLNHFDGARSVTDAVYDQHEFWAEMRAALCEFSDHPPTDLDLEPSLDRVLTLGPMHAGVMLGALGYRSHEKGALGNKLTGHVPAPSVDVIDTTGAGDAFHGAFALILAEGHPVQHCAVVAAEVAARKCTRLRSSAGLPRRAGVTALMDERA